MSQLFKVELVNKFKYYTALLFLVSTACSTTNNTIEKNYCEWSKDETRFELRVQNISLTDVMIETLIGNPQALSLRNGGVKESEIMYDIESHKINVVKNNFGIIEAIDLTSQCFLTPKSFINRKVGFFSLDYLKTLNQK